MKSTRKTNQNRLRCKNPQKSTKVNPNNQACAQCSTNLRAGTRKPPALTEQLCAQHRSPLRVAQLTEENHQHSTITARGAAQAARGADARSCRKKMKSNATVLNNSETT
ncbi:hypothetical protein A2U01_0058102 [Trifolium medium]|uniref:Uncharacterized protein n=1 Tax=Trifolium medium TaxID=97028 RepID=A0A392RJV7_9FABA|nr:hypothetical protein [Trifolium medium]